MREIKRRGSEKEQRMELYVQIRKKGSVGEVKK
jgi:hypothetical protein